MLGSSSMQPFSTTGWREVAAEDEGHLNSTTAHCKLDHLLPGLADYGHIFFNVMVPKLQGTTHQWGHQLILGGLQRPGTLPPAAAIITATDFSHIARFWPQQLDSFLRTSTTSLSLASLESSKLSGVL